KIALDNLDKVIRTIRQSNTQELAQENLIKSFTLSEAQAKAILAIQLARLAAMEQQKILEEYAQILKTIARLEDLLANAQKVDGLIKDELKSLKDKYGDERRTRIMREEAGEFTEEDLVPDEEVVVTMTRKNYIKRIP